MSRLFLNILVFSPFLLIKGQDTLYIDIQKAQLLAEKNYMSQYLVSRPSNNKKNIELPATDFNFAYGQLYTPERGWHFEVKQDFGQIFQYKQSSNIDLANQELEKSKVALSKKQYVLEVKSIFLQWIYLFNKQQIIEIKQEYLNRYRDVYSIKSALGYIEPVEKLMAETKASEIETEKLMCLYDIDLIQNTLRKLLNTKSFLKPDSKNLQLYMINKQSDTSVYSGDQVTNIYLYRYRKALAETEKQKAGILPAFNAGIFYQDVGPYSNLVGIEAGLQIPLLNTSRKEKIKNQTIESDQALARYNQSVLNSQYDIENLILKLDKCFIKIRHYQNYALPEANLTLSTCSAKYKAEEIDFDEYFQSITRAMQTKLEYVDCMNEYNQTALQLELYSK